MTLLTLDTSGPRVSGFGLHIRHLGGGPARWRWTVDGCRTTGSARVQSDQIEPRQQRLWQPGQQEGRVLHTRVARTARIEDHRADPIRLLLVPGPDDLQGDLFALGVGIVQRDQELSTPEVDLGSKRGCISGELRGEGGRAVAEDQPGPRRS